MLKQHQPPMNVEQQIENLKSLNCSIENEEKAQDFLNNVSYFRLIKGFGFSLKEKNSNYTDGVTFEQIKGLYLFNAKFRHLLFPEIEKVEINLRCRIANHFCCKYGVLGYKDSTNFQNTEHHQKCLEDIEAEIHKTHFRKLKSHCYQLLPLLNCHNLSLHKNQLSLRYRE